MPAALNLENQRFGRLVARELDINSTKKGRHWLCDCDCGGTATVLTGNLTSGHSTSCGCAQKEAVVAFNKETKVTHGFTGTRLYDTYRGMVRRCYEPQHKSYCYYGARGVQVCEEWLNNCESFFDWAIANGYEDYLTIERIDVNGDYSPDNCTWATCEEQANNRRSNKLLAYKGKTQSHAMWEKELGFTHGTIHNRLSLGWTIRRIIETPLKTYKKKEQN